MKKTGHVAKGHTSKHVGTSKHHALTAKHHPKHHHLSAKGLKEVRADRARAKAKHPHHARGFAIGDLLPVCSFEAVAQSLRLAGQRVTDNDVAGLWELAGRRAVSIGDALASFEVMIGEPFHGFVPVSLDVLDRLVKPGHALILGVDLPGPHAVLATADGWWSWGELHSPWTRHVSEAWAVSWS